MKHAQPAQSLLLCHSVKSYDVAYALRGFHIQYIYNNTIYNFPIYPTASVFVLERRPIVCFIHRKVLYKYGNAISLMKFARLLISN